MLKCLNRFSNYNLPPQLLQVLQNYTYVFNPSFVGLDGLNYMAVRVYCKTKMEVLALLFIWNDMEFKTLDFEMRIKNFSRLTIHKSMVEVMSDEYAKCSSKSYETIFELMWYETEMFQMKYHRKQALKKKVKFWKSK